jgi:uncharacterized protein YqgC (DUF456 family)
MDTHQILAAIFGLTGLISVVTVIFGLPGAWIMLAVAAGLELLSRGSLDAGPLFGGWALLAGVVLAGIGELIELGAGVLGAKGAGGTKRGSVGAFLGGLAGAVLGTFFIPVPAFGTLLGALLGTFGGAWLGETTGPNAREGRDAVKPALGATLARLAATVAKVGVALLVWVELMVAIFA